MPPAPLRNDIFDRPPAAAAALPGYDRAALTPRLLHIGVGGFHRAHQQTYLHELAERGLADWGVIGVGLRSRDVKDALEPQDLLYTVVERAPGEDRARVIATLERYLHAPEDPEAVIAALADDRIAIVTLTITANGYHVDPATREFDADAAEVQADLEHPERPATFFGFVVEALARRRRSGAGPFTVLSCDNVPCNGTVARAAVLGYARLRDAELASWIEQHVTFPNSMVDRITPETDELVAELVSDRFGIADNAPVVTERFRQWIVEDDFCNGRPPLEEVGVQFVDDVSPYELMKKRLLNGSHCALGYLGYLAGLRTTDEAMAEPRLHAYVEALMRDEVAPLLPAVASIDLGEYQRTLLERFANPKIKDDLQRLCGRGSTKMPSYVLPSIADALAQDRPFRLLALAVAGWLRYLRGVDFGGREIPIRDARKDELQPLVAGGDLDAVLADRPVFGDLGRDARFRAALEAALRDLDHLGPLEAIEDSMAGAEQAA